MDLSFKSIAFQLKYNSEQIDTIYRTLLLYGKGDYKVPAYMIIVNINLPSSFKSYVSCVGEDVNILFEQRIIENSEFNDWDLFEL